MKPCSFQWCPLPVRGHRRFCLNVKQHFSVFRWLGAGTGCVRRLWNLLNWGCSQTIWAWSFVTCLGWPCLNRSIGQDDLHRSLLTSLVSNSVNRALLPHLPQLTSLMETYINVGYAFSWLKVKLKPFLTRLCDRFSVRLVHSLMSSVKKKKKQQR